MVNNYKSKDRNFEILKNLNEINNCKNIINALNDINNDEDIKNKLNKIFNIYNLMNNKEEEKEKENNEIIIKNNLNENYSKENLCSNFNIVYDTLEEIKENIPNIKNFDFNRFLSCILLYEFNKNDDSDLRELILNKILSKNDLIKYSSQIINNITEKICVKCEPMEFGNNIKKIKEENSQLFSLLNNTKNDFLEEVIMNVFERKILKYFELIPTLKENDLENDYQIFYEQNENGKIINKTGIIFDKSFSIFKDAIKVLDDITTQNKEKYNLVKLYSIIYVKLYLYYMTNFLINNYHEMNNSFYDVIKYINEIGNKAFSKIIKIYMIKLIYNFKNNKYKELKNFEFEKRGINFYKEFEDLSKNEEIVLEYNFLPSKLNELEKYKEILQAYKENSKFSLDNKNLEILII